MTERNEANLDNLGKAFKGVEYATLSLAPQSTPLTEEQKHGCAFMPALEAKVWPKTIRNLGYNQAWIELYAESILAWLHEANQSKLLDLSKPVYLLLLGVVNYRLGLALLRRLLHEQASQGLIETKLCMVFTVDGKHNQTLLSNHPDFSYFYERQQALIVNWDTSSSSTIPTHALDGTALITDANPAILIGHKVFSQFPQTIYHIHYQQIFRAELALISNYGDGLNKASHSQQAQSEMPLLWEMHKQHTLKRVAQHNNQEVAINWLQTSIDEEATKRNEALSEWVKKVLQHHTLDGVSKMIAVPDNAVKVIREFEITFPKGSMQLISDGAQQAQGTTLLGNMRDYEITLPLDFMALNQVLADDNKVKTIELPCGHEQVSLSMSHRLDSNFDYTRHVFEQICKSSSPVTSAHVINSLGNVVDVLSEEQIQAHLVQSGYDPKVLAKFLPRLLKKGVSVSSRVALCDMLDNVWQNHVVDMEYETFAFELGLLAIDLSHWSLAKSCMLMRMDISGPSTACLHNLALSAWATGELDIAEQSITLASDLNPDDTQVRKLKSDIFAFRNRCARVAWFEPSITDERLEGVGLKLLPLGQHQLGEFFLQYRRPDIAERLRSVRLNTFAQLESIWPIWLEEGDLNQKAHFALVHEGFGLIGGVVVDFDNQEYCADAGDTSSALRAAQMSFWIGCDYQNRGFGRAGVKLAISHIQQLAKPLHLSHIKTSAWLHNYASRRILTRIGFTEYKRIKVGGSTEEVFYELSL
ncbi:GNAT family N-acetyltransferase [Pseudoalteromonas luteoviolacea]|uniref:GNAT family N-acetyltransferase n=1 Tax=Pseudoalteromonas luteoviolacea TaxID=43657 RepID=UPI001B37DC41|nr:GNAT family protein [Pseudoalteromonas luteoviolacea]MBQ4812899.1 GNAT family N-acetyltransferase [Pseudoalteromonas luteoviolacea]